jgi:hypothetical protein
MSASPASGKDNGRLLLFPFRVYTCIGFGWLFIRWPHHAPASPAFTLIVLAYFLCFFVFLAAGVVQIFRRPAKAAVSHFLFAGAALLLGFLLLPELVGV